MPPTHAPWSPLFSSKVPTLLRFTTRCLGKRSSPLQTKRSSMPIIGHVPWSVTVAEASNAGQRSMEHLDGPVLECAFASTPNLREQMVAAKVAPTPEILQSALDHCDPGKMTDLFKLLAKNETWQVPTLVQLLFTEQPEVVRDP